ncbi:branched-chain amino acid ABC transporter permease [Halorarius halobius]|uniref:branched-chain amino acid ABC transporter permease n=1 Tax=Halorarius halobius TaxID=2962671 RepID=UPI0020CEBBE2|nr:branched-chain amino acid ABC transporter permease [Halorarius halobius]
MSNESIRRRSTNEERRQALLRKLNPLNMPLRFQIGLLGLVGFIILPRFFYPNQMGPFINLLYLIMFAMSWDVVSGYTGQLSFGHAFFFAVGGYGSAVLQMQHGIPAYASIPLAVIVAAVAGVLVGLPALRLRGPYLSLVTLIVPVIFVKMLVLFNNSLVVFGIPIAPEGLGGTSGLSGLPQRLFSTAETAVVTTTDFQQAVLYDYYFALAMFGLILAVLLAVTRSSAGDVLTAIREDEDAVAAAGLNPSKFKLFAFVLSGTVGGLAGAALVHSSAAIAQPGPLLGGAGQAGSPIQLSINIIIMAILGGAGTIVGPVVGAITFAATEVAIGSMEGVMIPLVEVSVASLYPLPLLVAAMFVLFFLPDGVLPASIRAGRFALAYNRGEKDLDDAEITEKFEETNIGEIVQNYREELQTEIHELTDPDSRGDDR